MAVVARKRQKERERENVYSITVIEGDRISRVSGRDVVNLGELSSSRRILAARKYIAPSLCTTHNAISYFIRDSANESYKLVSIGRADGGRSKWSAAIPASRYGRLSLKGREARASNDIVIVILSREGFELFATRYEEVEMPGPEGKNGWKRCCLRVDGRARVDQWAHRTNEKIYG